MHFVIIIFCLLLLMKEVSVLTKILMSNHLKRDEQLNKKKGEEKKRKWKTYLETTCHLLY